jgi:hypothetical protein
MDDRTSSVLLAQSLRMSKMTLARSCLQQQLLLSRFSPPIKIEASISSIYVLGFPRLVSAVLGQTMMNLTTSNNKLGCCGPRWNDVVADHVGKNKLAYPGFWEMEPHSVSLFEGCAHFSVTQNGVTIVNKSLSRSLSLASCIVHRTLLRTTTCILPTKRKS